MARRGMSTLEVTVTLGVIATVSAVAVPRYRESAERSRADNAARRLASDIDSVRSLARAAGARQTLEFCGEGYTATLRTASGAASRRLMLTEPPFGLRMAIGVTDRIGVLEYDAFGRANAEGVIVFRVGEALRFVHVPRFGAPSVSATIPATTEVSAQDVQAIADAVQAAELNQPR